MFAKTFVGVNPGAQIKRAHVWPVTHWIHCALCPRSTPLPFPQRSKEQRIQREAGLRTRPVNCTKGQLTSLSDSLCQHSGGAQSERIQSPCPGTPALPPVEIRLFCVLLSQTNARSRFSSVPLSTTVVSRGENCSRMRSTPESEFPVDKV